MSKENKKSIKEKKEKQAHEYNKKVLDNFFSKL